MIEKIGQQLSRTFDGRRHAKWARVSAMIIITISIAYALMLPSDAMSRMSHDSFRYLAGAYSILASGTYLDISGATQSHWPPGTSILYAAVAKFSDRPPEELVKFVNLAALLLMAASLWCIIEITIERWWIAVITFASIMLNTAILSMQNKLWSDPLALATSSAALASGIVGCRGGKNWYGWICAASVLLSIAICIRYAMLPGIPILAAAAFWLSKKTASHREAVLLPLLSPLVTLIAFYFLTSTYHPVFSMRSVEMVISFDFWRDWPAFIKLADQVFPVAGLTNWISMSLVTVCLIVVPTGVSFVALTPQKRSTLLICVGYVLLSCIFLVIAPVVFHSATELRYLLQIYPFMLIGGAIAADLLLKQQRVDSQILAFVIVGLLSIAAARSTRAAALGFLSHGSQQSVSCVSRAAVAGDLKRILANQSPSSILTNIQGLAWYVLRIPTFPLRWSTLATAPKGAIIVFVRPEYTCNVVESDDISETALSSAPNLNILSSSGPIMVGTKQ